jgi:hypothetical protein
VSIQHNAQPVTRRHVLTVQVGYPEDFGPHDAYRIDRAMGDLQLNPAPDVGEQIRCIAAVLRDGALTQGPGLVASRRLRLAPATGS